MNLIHLSHCKNWLPPMLPVRETLRQQIPFPGWLLYYVTRSHWAPFYAWNQLRRCDFQIPSCRVVQIEPTASVSGVFSLSSTLAHTQGRKRDARRVDTSSKYEYTLSRRARGVSLVARRRDNEKGDTHDAEQEKEGLQMHAPARALFSNPPSRSRPH